jgi:hypothetical protein
MYGWAVGAGMQVMIVLCVAGLFLAAIILGSAFMSVLHQRFVLLASQTIV